MTRLRAFIQMAVPCILLLCNGQVSASPDTYRHHGTLQDVIEQVVDDVVEIKIRDLHNEIQVRIGSNDHDYDRRREYRHRHDHLSYSSRRALKRLDREHERAIRRLEAELEYKLREVEHDFRHDVRHAHKAKKIAHKRRKLSKEVDKAYRHFHRKLAREDDRFDEQRHRILSGRWDA